MANIKIKKAYEETEEEKEQYILDKIPFLRDADSLETLRGENYIAVVTIFAHSSLPYNQTAPMHVFGMPFDQYTIPVNMNFHKITLANNGEAHCVYLNPDAQYEIKETIENSLAEYYTRSNSNELVNNLSINLKKFNNQVEPHISKEREILNKILKPTGIYTNKKLHDGTTINKKKYYSPAQLVLHYIQENVVKSKTLDLFPYIRAKYKVPPSQNRHHLQAIRTGDIIKFLHEYLKIKNVVLIDLSCSSWGESNLPAGHESFISNLNHNNIRGGQKSLRNKKRKPFKVTRSKALSRRNRGTRKKA
jgi:hypothetical protein